MCLEYVTLLHSIVPLCGDGSNWYQQTQTNLMSPASFTLPLFRLAVKFRYILLVSVGSGKKVDFMAVGGRNRRGV